MRSRKEYQHRQKIFSDDLRRRFGPVQPAAAISKILIGHPRRTQPPPRATVASRRLGRKKAGDVSSGRLPYKFQW
jgi:hypothetical protein